MISLDSRSHLKLEEYNRECLFKIHTAVAMAQAHEVGRFEKIEHFAAFAKCLNAAASQKKTCIGDENHVSFYKHKNEARSVATLFMNDLELQQ